MIYQKGKKIEEIKHLYIHVPFCKSLCRYCDFYSIIFKKNYANLYTQAILNELDLYTKNISNKLESIYFGGGTPFLLGIENLKKILDSIYFIINKNSESKHLIETSIELNPYHFFDNKNLLNDLSQIGFNRYSIGIQSFDKKILDSIDRNFDFSLVDTLIKNNCKNINIDMMFALPGQDIIELENDINYLIKIKPKHISWYLFTVKKGLYKNIVTESKQERMYNFIIDKLRTRYNHYEISNFSKKGYKSVHNLAYWKRFYYLGLGAASHSFIKYNNKEYRYSNISSFSEHVKDIKTFFKIEKLDDKTIYNEKIFLGLRLINDGFNINLLNKEASNLIKDNYLIKKNEKVLINKNKLFLIDELSKRLLSD